MANSQITTLGATQVTKCQGHDIYLTYVLSFIHNKVQRDISITNKKLYL
jgi:hypothetical protein